MPRVTTSREETGRLLDRIKEIDPRIRAVNAANPHALAEAESLDHESAEGRRRSPLHGRPVLVKDNIDTAGLASTAGSLALADEPPGRDAALVRRLRKAGLVVLGKTNLSEWANIRDEHATSGWSAHGGLTRNPYALNRTAWGSSSGSGAAVAARLAPFAIGTETNGSITAPAAACGLVGLKPTVGLVSTDGVVPISASQDAPGPMTLTVAENAALLDVLAGTDTTAALEAGVRGRRIGVPRDLWGYSPAADAAARAGAGDAVRGRRRDRRRPRAPRAQGPRRRPGAQPDADRAGPRAGGVSRGTRRLGPLACRRRGVQPCPRRRGDAVVRTVASSSGPWTWRDRRRTQYRDAVDACAVAGLSELDHTLSTHHLDALLAPAMAPPSPIDLVNGDHGSGGASDSSALAGAPILTLPIELAPTDLPVAVSIWGARGSEQTALRRRPRRSRQAATRPPVRCPSPRSPTGSDSPSGPRVWGGPSLGRVGM